MATDPIIAVVGMPRSGTSLTMGLLEAGGVPIYCEPDNLGSSYESEAILDLPRDDEFLSECHGKAIKLLDPLHFRPPTTHRYDFIWTSRGHKEQARSHRKLARALGIEGAWPLGPLVASLRKDEKRSLSLLRRYPGSRVHVVRFEQLLAAPTATATELAGFLLLDPSLIPAMAARVTPRGPNCLPYLAELSDRPGSREPVTPKE